VDDSQSTYLTKKMFKKIKPYQATFVEQVDVLLFNVLFPCFNVRAAFGLGFWAGNWTLSCLWPFLPFLPCPALPANPGGV
jgi:hypothetical protein